MLPVCFCVIKKTIECIFRELLLQSISFYLHIHAPIGEYQTEQTTEDIRNRNSLFFTGIAFKQQPANLEIFHKFCNTTGNFILNYEYSIVYYTWPESPCCVVDFGNLIISPRLDACHFYRLKYWFFKVHTPNAVGKLIFLL